MDPDATCPICRVLGRARALLARARAWRPGPVSCEVTALVPLPGGRRLAGGLTTRFFLKGTLCKAKYFAATEGASPGGGPLASLGFALGTPGRSTGDDDSEIQNSHE